MIKGTSKVSVTVWPYIEYREGNGESFYKYYKYNKVTGEIEEYSLSLEEYYNLTNTKPKSTSSKPSASPTVKFNYVPIATKPLIRMRRINS